MTSFDDRKKAQENKFAHDEEMKFKAMMRAVKLFGTWLAKEAKLGSDYNAKLVNLATSGKKPADIVKMAQADAANSGKKLGRDMLEEKFNGFLNEAREQIQKR